MEQFKDIIYNKMKTKIFEYIKKIKFYNLKDDFFYSKT